MKEYEIELILIVNSHTTNECVRRFNHQ